MYVSKYVNVDVECMYDVRYGLIYIYIYIIYIQMYIYNNYDIVLAIPYQKPTDSSKHHGLNKSEGSLKMGKSLGKMK